MKVALTAWVWSRSVNAASLNRTMAPVFSFQVRSVVVAVSAAIWFTETKFSVISAVALYEVRSLILIWTFRVAALAS